MGKVLGARHNPVELMEWRDTVRQGGHWEWLELDIVFNFDVEQCRRLAYLREFWTETATRSREIASGRGYTVVAYAVLSDLAGYFEQPFLRRYWLLQHSADAEIENTFDRMFAPCMAVDPRSIQPRYRSRLAEIDVLPEIDGPVPQRQVTVPQRPFHGSMDGRRRALSVSPLARHRVAGR